jgi:hypothetical protein
VGSTVYLTSNGMKQRQDVLSGGSYASSNDQRVHFGIGDATTMDAVEIHWPGNAIEQVKLPGIDRIFTVEQGKGVTGETCGKCPATAIPVATAKTASRK